MRDLARHLEDAKLGDQEAFRLLFERYRGTVLRLLDGFGSLDGDERQDVVQETFARAFRSLEGLRDPAQFERWVCAIARNRALTAVQRRHVRERTKQELSVEPPEPVLPTPSSVQLEIEAQVVRDLIEQLPPGPERETVYLFYVEGALSAREIAEKLGVGKSAITMRLERFRVRVKREIVLRVLRARGSAP